MCGKKLTYFERKLKGMGTPAVDVFTNIEKGIAVAESRWAEDPDPNLWDFFVLKRGNNVVFRRK